MEVRPVRSRRELQCFVELPYALYRDDPQWVAPLRREQWSQLDRARNPMLDHCEYELFLLWDQGRPLGRISAFVDSLATEAWGQPIGLFGSYECARTQAGAMMLLEAARTWLRDRGMTHMRGSWSFASQEWGQVIEGYAPPPVIMAPHNPPYYHAQLEAFGLSKAKDLLVYYVDASEGYVFPSRYLTLTDRVQSRYGVGVRSVDMRELDRDVGILMEVSNRSISDNWGYYPVTPSESAALARDLRPLINPRGVLIAEDRQGQAIGFAIAVPDINRLLRGLNGRLFPLGWLKLLLGMPRLHAYRMWALGVIPEYQGRAVDALLYRRLYEGLFRPDFYMEINYVLEDNTRMNNALRNLGAKPLRRYRVYEMTI